jgi:large subunit ribosomal protein L16
MKPKKSKFKKQQKGRNLNRIKNVFSLNRLNFGSIGLVATTSGRITENQLESIKQNINKTVKKFGFLKINVFPQSPITKKPLEIRMGKGKGSVDHWVVKIPCGTIILEIKTTLVDVGLKALKAAQFRFPIKTKILFN